MSRAGRERVRACVRAEPLLLLLDRDGAAEFASTLLLAHGTPASASVIWDADMLSQVRAVCVGPCAPLSLCVGERVRVGGVRACLCASKSTPALSRTRTCART